MRRTAIPVAILILLGLALVACSSGGKSSTPDRGISACQHYAGPQQQGSNSSALVTNLQASSFADLKAAGDAESKAFASGDSGQQLSAGHVNHYVTDGEVTVATLDG